MTRPSRSGAGPDSRLAAELARANRAGERDCLLATPRASAHDRLHERLELACGPCHRRAVGARERRGPGGDRCRDGEPLPVQTINLSVISAGAAVMSVLLHRFTPDNNVWRVLLLIAVVGPVAVVLFALARSEAGPPGGTDRSRVAARRRACGAVDALLRAVSRRSPPDPEVADAGARLGTGAHGGVRRGLAAPRRTVPRFPFRATCRGRCTAVEGGGLHAAATRTASVLVGVLPLVAAVCLLLRYPRSGPVVRQQIRVGAVGLSAGVLLEVALLWTLPGVEAGKVHFAIAWWRWPWGRSGWRPRCCDGGCGWSTRHCRGRSCSAPARRVHRVRSSWWRRSPPVGCAGNRCRERCSPRSSSPSWSRATAVGWSRGCARSSTASVPAGTPCSSASPTGWPRKAPMRHRAGSPTRRVARLAVPWAALWAPTARPGVYRLAAKAGDVQAAYVVRLGEDDSSGLVRRDCSRPDAAGL